MNRLRNIIPAAVLSMLLFIIVAYTACTKDTCADIQCQNNGVCVDGKCNCPAGYSGDRCETKSNPCAGIECKNEGKCVNGECECPPGFEGEFCEILSINKYVGSWIGTDSCKSGDTGTIKIEGIPGAALEAIISNPAGLGMEYNVTGFFTGANVLTIPAQQVLVGITLNGSIVFQSPSSLRFGYRIVNSTTSTSDTCTGIYSK